MPYHYRPLSHGSSDIRLLVLAPGEPSSVLECELYTAKLKDTESRYEALSYTWGDASNVEEIRLDGQSFEVTVNLATALKHLRGPEKKVLWVDAICIDQKNNQEKAEQIPRMADIFRSATLVHAWTGMPSEDSDTAISQILELGRLIMASSDDLLGETARGTYTPQFFQDAGLDIEAMDWGAIFRFWNRPYWTRAWVLQELASCEQLNPESTDRCIIHCGSQQFPKRLHDGALLLLTNVKLYVHEWVTDSQVTLGPLRSVEELDSFPYAVMMFSLELLCAEDESPVSIDQILRSSSFLKATDPRDKIYAFLGMCGLEQKIVADYSLPVEEVYMDFVRFCIEDQQSLSCLQGNRVTSTSFGPSWIPDFSRLTTVNGLSLSWYINTTDVEAAGNSVPHMHMDNQSGLITLKGVSVALLETVIGPFTPENSGSAAPNGQGAVSAPRNSAHYQNLFRFQKLLSDSQHEYFWRALVLDQAFTGTVNDICTPAPQSVEQSYRVFFGLDPIPKEFKPESNPIDRKSQYTLPLTINMDRVSPNSCFIATNKGEMGWGPYNSQVGDKIVILAGGPLCFVLRPKGEHYELIGDAYLQGLMNGDYFNTHKDTSMEDFILC